MKFSSLCLHSPKTIIEVHRRITAAEVLEREGHIADQLCLEIKKMPVQQPLVFGSKSIAPAYPYVFVLIHPYSFGAKQTLSFSTELCGYVPLDRLQNQGFIEQFARSQVVPDYLGVLPV